MTHTPRSTEYRIGNNASQADIVMLTGETTAAGQRDACDRLGIPYTQRRVGMRGGPGHLIDECTVYVDERVYMSIRAAERKSMCLKWLHSRAA